MAHIATEALRHRLPKGPCKSCGRGRDSLCRHSTPLNGGDAAAEFSRHLLPQARNTVYGIES